MRKLLAVAAIALMAAVMAVPASAATVVVKMESVGPSFQFVPNQLVIHEGDVVEWRNASAVSHTSTSGTGSADPESGKRWDSGLLGPGGTFQHVFTTVGTYDYYCVPHELSGMSGQITVIASVPSTNWYGKAGLIALLLALGAMVMWRRRPAIAPAD